MPPKVTKGILGVKKDPKKQILFSFGARAGDEWPSDDSGDSDYCPSDHSESAKNTHIPVKKLKKKHGESKTSSCKDAKVTASGSGTTQSQRSKKSKHYSHSSVDAAKCKDRKLAESSGSGECWASGLPWQVLEQIFEYVVHTEGPLPFLCRVSKVCSCWRDAACHPSLWRKVDLSYGWIKSNERTLKWLCENRFTRLREVNLCTWKTLTNSSLQLLATNCPDLQDVGLSHCGKINADGVRMLIDRCEKLTGLDLSYVQSDAVSPVIMKHLVETKGHQLKKLNLSGNTLRNFTTVFNSICANCPELQVLQVNKAQFSNTTLTINIEKFQEGCRKLRVLELSLTSYRAPYAAPTLQAASPGFPMLEDVSLAIDTNTYITVCLDDDFLHRLLKNSYNLKSLDLRGSSNIHCRNLQNLPATDLQHLYISLSSIAKYTGIEIIMSKWQHSLKELDLSWNLYPGMSLDCAMRKLSDDPSKSALESLNLSGTSITCDRVKAILEGCPKLSNLNLCSCRGLPRGMKREYDSTSLDHLRDTIDDVLREEKDEQHRRIPASDMLGII